MAAGVFAAHRAVEFIRHAQCLNISTFGENPLRPNPLKPRLTAGGCAFGTMTFEFFTPGYPAICHEAGAEFILYDMEHSGVGFETMKAQFAFCRGLDLVASRPRSLGRLSSHRACARHRCDGHHGAYG